MLIVLTFLSLLTHIPGGDSRFSVCIPNSQFQWNGQICICDRTGRWSELNCHAIERRQSCRPGQVIWGNCTQCVCQDNGQMLCTNIPCNEDSITIKPMFQLNHFEAAGPWCTPFRSYYINCSLCVCPASGKTSEATCVVDASCSFTKLTLASLSSSLKNICIPKVMYLFPCLHCLCSDDGYFTATNCIETCQKQQPVESRKCIPKTFYRKECNICRCPENGVQNPNLCSNNKCTKRVKFRPLHQLQNKPSKCDPHKFTKPVCFYCNCNHEGNVNFDSCVENECLQIPDLKYNLETITCSPGEMAPICMECFCPTSGVTNESYCTRTCNFRSKLTVVEKVLVDSTTQNDLINRDVIKHATRNDICVPGSLYTDQGRYCLCPDNASSNFKLCTSVTGNVDVNEHKDYNDININFNMTCEPGTFIDFDCNSCYCTKNGTIDPRWCTYDDCHAKKVILDSYKIQQFTQEDDKSILTCVPGSMSKVDCNFCICPESGLLEERACTKNDCTEFQGPKRNEKLLCDPLTYYLVDCNICFCPRDGLKNVVKCTKNHCEKNFLRSDLCIPGDLFSDNCNVCVCPPNGVKVDKACTNHTCLDADTPWHKIFNISQNILTNKAVEKTARSLDLCFPGEEFVVGCKVCVCPDMGLREYASCIPMLCNEGNAINDDDALPNVAPRSTLHDAVTMFGVFNSNATVAKHSVATRKGGSCMTYNMSDSSEKKECTPGSMYIIRCRQCICPYMGNIMNFCRPLPKGFQCELTYTNPSNLQTGRRYKQLNVQGNFSAFALTSTISSQKRVTISHNHTEYRCEKSGRMADDCFICDCENNVIVEEHCFKSDEGKCNNTFPTFLSIDNKIST